MNRGLSWGRLVLFAAGAIPGGAMLRWGHVLTDGNTDASRILVTAFSILVGFLIAVITMSGDPRGLYPGSWRMASAHAREIRRALCRYQLLFYAYLGVILLVLLAKLFGRLATEIPAVLWLDRLSLSLGVAALIWSFGLPTRLIRVQMERLQDEVATRKEAAKTTSHSNQGQAGPGGC